MPIKKHGTTALKPQKQMYKKLIILGMAGVPEEAAIEVVGRMWYSIDWLGDTVLSSPEYYQVVLGLLGRVL